MTDNVADVNKDTYRLRDRLIGWTPWDEAAWYLARGIGLFPEHTDYATFRGEYPPTWTNTPIGNALYENLQNLVHADVLEKRQEDTRDYEFRWKS
jgi:hypothetical protein